MATSDTCPLEDCPGMNDDGTCPNGYGITCESVFPEPSNMGDDPLAAHSRPERDGDGA